ASGPPGRAAPSHGSADGVYAATRRGRSLRYLVSVPATPPPRLGRAMPSAAGSQAAPGLTPSAARAAPAGSPAMTPAAGRANAWTAQGPNTADARTASERPTSDSFADHMSLRFSSAQWPALPFENE